MDKPTLSVTFSNYNHGRFLPVALEAIFSQSYPAKEVIIVDDASTDDSVPVIEEFAQQHSNLQFIRNSRNMGTLHNSRVLFDAASGDYIYSTAADDRILPGFFEKSMQLLESFPEAGLCFSDPAFFTETEGPIRENRLELAAGPRYFDPKELVELLKRRRFQIPGHTSILKRTVLLEAGGLLPQLKWHCDWFVLWVLAFRYGACYFPEALATLRISPNSYSAAGRRNSKAQMEVLDAMTGLLRGPYADVAPMFKRGAVASVFGLPILYSAMRKRDWNQVSFRLVRRVLRNEIMRRVLMARR